MDSSVDEDRRFAGVTCANLEDLQGPALGGLRQPSRQAGGGVPYLPDGDEAGLARVGGGHTPQPLGQRAAGQGKVSLMTNNLPFLEVAGFCRPYL